MSLKVLFMMFLCLFVASILCNAAMTISNAFAGGEVPALANAVVNRLAFNGTEPQMGDPKGGDGWP